VWKFVTGGEKASVDADIVLATLDDLGRPLTDEWAWRLLARLGDHVFAGSCYASLLGRWATAPEVESYEARLRRGEPYGGILREFMCSEEFAWQRHPAFQIRALDRCVDRLVDLVRRSTRCPPAVAVGSEIVFGWHNPNATRYLFGSWYGLEADSVWSRGPVGELAFRVDRPEPGPLLIEADLRVGAALASTPQHIEFLCNGELRRSVSVDHPRFFRKSRSFQPTSPTRTRSSRC
jgi:hypothetical protein